MPEATKKPANSEEPKSRDVPRVAKFAFVGLTVTLTDYALGELLVLLVFHSTDFLWLISIFTGIATIGLSFVLHKKITWKERQPTQNGLLKYFIWNLIVLIIVRPILALIFGCLTGLYEWAFELLRFLPIHLSLDFITTTGVYGFMTLTTMIMNFYFYGRVIFSDSKP